MRYQRCWLFKVNNTNQIENEKTNFLILMLTLMFMAGVLFGGFGSFIPLEFSHILEQPSKHSNIWTGTHCVKMFSFFSFIGEAKQEIPLSKLTLAIILALLKDYDLFSVQ